jgi:hypothetical protein
LDPSFRELAEELAEMLGIDILDAAALLHPVSKATYDAAAGAIRR